MPRMLPPRRRPPRQVGIAIAAFLLLLIFGRSICGVIIDYAWWRELGQIDTWWRIALYRNVPGIAAWLIVFMVLWISHARGMRHAGARLREHPLYGWVVTLALAVVSIIIALAAIDGWVIVRYFGGHGQTISEWTDPQFGQPLGFYFFDLPLYSMLIDFLATCALGGALVYYLAARGWQLRRDFPNFSGRSEIDLSDLRSLGRLESGVLRGLTAAFLVMLAVVFWLGRYDLLLSDHGNLLVGIDYVQQHLGLPMQIVKAGAALLAAVLVLAGRRKIAIACAAVLLIDWILPATVSAVYVRPNELTLERPFIERHIAATRSAFGLDHRATESEFVAHADARIDFQKNRPLLDNVRLWDWRAFHDTLSQKQPLRPFTYADTDVDRYQIDGRLRQILLSPRELDLSALGDAASSWINRSLIFTHGYGLVLAEANRVTTDALPVMLIKDAPVQVLTPSLKITRPQIYYGETLHSPVFVHTAQNEFDYPSGSSEVTIHYDGAGGFPLNPFGMRTMAAISEGDSNIFLSNALTSDTRMMIRRRIPERLNELASFVTWDSDPYMVITDAGKLIWIIDGYLTSDAHPYSRSISFENGDRFNYIRNSIKATIDAYDGSVKMYVFDPQDPLVNAYQRLFPDLFSPASEMPADVRAHTRAPETLFRLQAEIFRTYHMREVESFYNRADLWDLATYTTGQTGAPQAVPPTYLIAMLPGKNEPEFLLTIPFTPRNKTNLIGLMAARCDGEHLGELVVLDLPKQEIIPGPAQIESLINQDQNISKDLTLWNQQGSQVLRSQILTLPIDQTFLFVAPIYIQAVNAKMPQLKKVALAVGNSLAYADTYEQALAQLAAIQAGQAPPSGTSANPPTNQVTSAAAASGSTPAASNDPRVAEIRAHLNRYRELSAQGKWAEAGKELEAIEALVKK
jgi:uncharacterized membrane protein (UPF0182 family)